MGVSFKKPSSSSYPSRYIGSDTTANDPISRSKSCYFTHSHDIIMHRRRRRGPKKATRSLSSCRYFMWTENFFPSRTKRPENCSSLFFGVHEIPLDGLKWNDAKFPWWVCPTVSPCPSAAPGLVWPFLFLSPWQQCANTCRLMMLCLETRHPRLFFNERRLSSFQTRAGQCIIWIPRRRRRRSRNELSRNKMPEEEEEEKQNALPSSSTSLVSDPNDLLRPRLPTDQSSSSDELIQFHLISLSASSFERYSSIGQSL